MEKEKIIESLLEVLPILKDMLHQDLAIAVTDTEKYVGYSAGFKLDVKVNVGQDVNKDDPLYRTIHENISLVNIVPKDVFGIVFQATTYPLRDKSGKVIGAVGVGRNIEQQMKIQESSESLHASLEQSNATIEEIAQGSQKLLQMVNSVLEASIEAQRKINESTEIINLIQKMATQSNMLGLNAAIEASRAGEAGRGFNVVASEMRKLANSSKESSSTISKSLNDMQQFIQLINNTVNEIEAISENQSSATEEMSATMMEITSNSEYLANAAKLE